MRVVLTTFGTLGEVKPTLALARAFAQQGDEPIVVTNPSFAYLFEEAGLAFRNCGEPCTPESIADDPRLTHPTKATFNIWKLHFLPRVLPFFETVRELIREAPTAAVVNHYWCFGGFLAAEVEKVPCMNMAIAPCLWFSEKDPTSVYRTAALPEWVRRLSLRWDRFLINATLGRDLKKISKGLDLDFDMDYFAHQERSVCNVGWWSPTLRGLAGDDPPGAFVAGFPWTGQGHEKPPLEGDLEEFLSAGPPPVVLGLGSFLGRSRPDIFRAVVEACQALGQRALLIGGDPEQLPELPDTVHATPFAPHSTVFARGCVTIHHGGCGTLGEALRAGRPSVVFPIAYDQFDNARRAELTGQCVVLKQRRISAEDVRKALARCISDKAMQQRATEIGQAVAAEEDGAVQAARRIREQVT